MNNIADTVPAKKLFASIPYELSAGRRDSVLLVALVAGPLLLQHADVDERLVHLGRDLQRGKPIEALEAVLAPVLA